MLSDFEEIAWVNRPNGFKEGVIKTTNLKNLNLENRHLYVSFISEINSYLKEKSLSFAFPIENLFIKKKDRKKRASDSSDKLQVSKQVAVKKRKKQPLGRKIIKGFYDCLLYTSDAADE